MSNYYGSRQNRGSFSRNVRSDNFFYNGESQGKSDGLSRYGNHNKEGSGERGRGRGRGRGQSRGRGYPAGLTGKEIGLYFRDKNRKRNEEKKIFSISPDLANEIQCLLNTSRCSYLNNAMKTESSNCEKYCESEYEHIKDSQFKKKFLRIISGNIQDNLTKAMLMDSKLNRNKSLDEDLHEDLLKVRSSAAYKEILTFRKKLPSYKMREEILDLVDQHQVILISGETGCGKTTQVAQFILEHEIEKGNGSITSIVCTQPRRISAISVAERVAAERAEDLGKSVGFQIRLEKIQTRETGNIMFCTTGILLQHMQHDPALRNYSHIILDEIHERSTQSDFIMALLKQVVPKRPDLKVILMSATLNAEQFSKYYNNCPSIHIPGFTYPVEEFYLEDVLLQTKFKFPAQSTMPNDYRRFMKKYKKHQEERNEFVDFIEPYLRHLESLKRYPQYVIDELKNPESEKLSIELVEALVHHISLTKGPGAILIFLPGMTDISALHKMMQNSTRYPRDLFVIYPLHSRMPTADQKLIFKTPPPGVRKIIIATSIAETSITVEDVVYVIDCGKTKLTRFDLENNIETLLPEWITIANAKQRKGRAGRVKPGICYHLFSKVRSDTFDHYPLPEMLRTRLEEVILQLKILQLGKADKFLSSVMDPPNSKAIDLSLELLRMINALDDNERLTPLGYHLAQLPLNPQTGKMIIWAALFSCVEPVFSIAASLSFKDAFYCPLGMEAEADARKHELSMGESSDHIALAEALKRFEEAQKHSWRSADNFCYKYFLSKNTLRLLSDMKKQFACHLFEMKFLTNDDPRDPSANKNSRNLSLVKAIVCAGLYPNVALIRNVTKRGAKVITEEDGLVKIHPSSVNEKNTKFPYPYLTYYVKQRSTAIYLHDTTSVSPHALLLASPYCSVAVKDQMYYTVTVAKGITFHCQPQTAKLIQELQKRLSEILEYKINHPGTIQTGVSEQNILKAVIALVTHREGDCYKGNYLDSDSDDNH